MYNFLHKIKYYFPIVGITILVLLFPDFVFAQAEQSTEQKFSEFLAQITKFILGVLYPVMWMIVGFVGSLMDNSFVLSADIEAVIKSAWQMIRNFVNIVFALGLVVIAIYNIIGKTEGNFVLKTILPKFAIALIAVNFSFFIGKVLLDANNLITTAIFAIPQDIYKEEAISEMKCYKMLKDGETPPDDANPKKPNPGDYYLTKCTFPRFIYVDFTKPILDQKKQEGGDKKQQLEVNEQLIKFAEETPLDWAMFRQNSVGVILAVNVFQIQNLINVAKVGDLSGLTINAFFSIMFIIIYGAAFVALAAVLLVRAGVIWICLALSPLIALLYVFEGLSDKMKSFDIKDQFIKNAFAPAIIAVPLTLGFVLIQAAVNGGLINYTANAVGKGAFPSGTSTITINAEGAVKGMADPRAILWNIAVVVLIFTGVKQAANGTAAGFITDKIFSAVEGAGRFVGQLPGYIPIVPMGPGGQKVSLMAGMDVAHQIAEKFRGKPREQAKRAFSFLYGGEDVMNAEDIRKARTWAEAEKVYGHAAREGRNIAPDVHRALTEKLPVANDETKRRFTAGVTGGTITVKENDSLVSYERLVAIAADNNDKLQKPAQENIAKIMEQQPERFVRDAQIQAKEQTAVTAEREAKQASEAQAPAQPSPPTIASTELDLNTFIKGKEQELSGAANSAKAGILIEINNAKAFLALKKSQSANESMIAGQIQGLVNATRDTNGNFNEDKAGKYIAVIDAVKSKDKDGIKIAISNLGDEKNNVRSELEDFFKSTVGAETRSLIGDGDGKFKEDSAEGTFLSKISR